MVIMLGICLFLTSFAPFRHLGEPFGSGGGGRYALGFCAPWLGFLYLIGATIRKHTHNIRNKIHAKWFIVGYLGCVAINIIWIRLCVWGWLPFFRMSDILQYTSPTTLMQAVFLLLFFKRLQLQHIRKYIAFLSTFAFSVYLIHTHPLIYSRFFKDANHWLPTTPWYLTAAIALIAGIGIFTGCLLLDMPRYWLFSIIRKSKE